MKFGVFTVSTPEYDIEETARVLSELGYDGVEWRVSAPAPAEKPANYSFGGRYWSYNLSTLDVKNIVSQAEPAKAACARYNLEIYSLTTYLGAWDLEDIENCMEAAQIMGCPNVRVNVPGYDGKENYRQLFDRTVKQVKLVEQLAAKYGVRACFEIHMGNMIPSASAAYRFASNFDSRHIGIIYDPGNMVHEGFENYQLGLELLGEYLSHVHVKNAVWELTDTTKEGAEVWKPVWSPLMKGYADITRLIGILKDMGFDGYVSVEDFSNEEETYPKLKSNIEFLKKLRG